MNLEKKIINAVAVLEKAETALGEAITIHPEND
jgi:hypothetical protein